MVQRLLVVACLLSTAAWAQVAGRVSGTISDASGAAVSDAKVSLRLAGSTGDLFGTRSNSEGTFALPGVRPETYDVVIEKTGFETYKIAALKVDAARDTVLAHIQLEVAAVRTSIEVSGEATTINVESAQISNTLRTEQIKALPMVDRDPLQFIVLQVGVNSGRGNTTINGLRVSMNNMTVDGINVQDNFLRSNALDLFQNRMNLDSVAEMTVTTSNADNNAGFGAGQVNFSTPSGGNQWHGAMLWTNRNNKLAANTWFNNRDGLALPRLNQNQVGANIGGPLKKNKLFFYSHWEILRNRQQVSSNRTILTEDARQGIFTYLAGGVVRKVNVLNAGGVQADPTMQALLAQIPAAAKINNFRVGDSNESVLRNTAGYSFLRRANIDQNNGVAKADYTPSLNHSLALSVNINHELVDRSSQDNSYALIPTTKNDGIVKLLSGSWRWNPAATLTNELRGGFNLAPALFLNDTVYGKQIFAGMLYSNPVNTTRAQGRYTDTFNFSDNLTYLRGKHTFQVGGQMQKVNVSFYDDADIASTYTIGMGTGNQGLVASQLPGIGANDLAGANALLATLAGYVTAYQQTFNVASRTSGFVPNQQLQRDLRLNQLAFYGQDRWKATRRLTLNLGVRWDYYSPVDETNGLGLLPVLKNKNPISSLLDQDNSLDFAGGNTGRRFYQQDKNNFAPNFGFAWDIFGNGKSALRGGYSIAFVNDESIAAVFQSAVLTNEGLQTTSFRSGLTGRVSSLPTIPTPTLKVPRTFADNYAVNPSTAFALPDPGLVTPYVQQWSLGIQQEIKHNVIEISWVGNHATKQFRSFDFNQVVIGENGFLADFQRARNNGFIAQRAGLGFNPNYNPGLQGSQLLSVFPKLASGGLFTNGTVLTLLQQGSVGELAHQYQVSGLNGPVGFYRNPNALGTNLLTNYSNSTYNGLQVNLSRRLANLTYQVNYTYSRNFSDAPGSQQVRFDPFLDLGNGKIERSRVADFDLAQVFKALAQYPLPIGPGHALNNRMLAKVLGGWQLSGIFVAQTGGPFSVLSARGTLNRGARSGNNTVNTALNGEQLADLFQFRMTPTGPYFVNASAIGPDGRAVAADGQASFAGQSFFQPDPGTIGALQRNRFSGPSMWSLDMAVMKRTVIREQQWVELRMDVQNVTNTPTWGLGNQSVTSTQFGRVTGFSSNGVTNPSRLVQLGLRYQF